jgi:hypothetical protein
MTSAILASLLASPCKRSLSPGIREWIFPVREAIQSLYMQFTRRGIPLKKRFSYKNELRTNNRRPNCLQNSLTPLLCSVHFLSEAASLVRPLNIHKQPGFSRRACGFLPLSPVFFTNLDHRPIAVNQLPGEIVQLSALLPRRSTTQLSGHGYCQHQPIVPAVDERPRRHSRQNTRPKTTVERRAAKNTTWSPTSWPFCAK